MMDEAHMHEVARANQLAHDLAITQANLESLRASIMAACSGTKCLNAHELRQRLDKAEADRDVLATALRSWVKQNEEGLFGDEDWTRLMQLTDDASGALTRAKAMEEKP